MRYVCHVLVATQEKEQHKGLPQPTKVTGLKVHEDSTCIDVAASLIRFLIDSDSFPDFHPT
jgi:hypothetical protein